MSGPLCEAVVYGERAGLAAEPSGQATLEYLERANLFVVPLDNARSWYRYHHLFAELLRQRLQQRLASSAGDEGPSGAELHRRASQWYEDHGLQIEAFRHAAAAHDMERAERLIKGGEIPCTRSPQWPPSSTGWTRWQRPHWMPGPGCGSGPACRC